jgi:glucose dehydrogenase
LLALGIKDIWISFELLGIYLMKFGRQVMAIQGSNFYPIVSTILKWLRFRVVR